MSWTDGAQELIERGRTRKERSKKQSMTTSLLNADPPHARAAPPHPDPYPWYGRLARERGLFRDETNNWWVAASAAAVREVLTSELCLTRPLSEPIPASLRDGAVADIFGRLVRLRDDAPRNRLKDAVTAALRSLDLRHVADLTRTRAGELDGEIGLPFDPAKTTRFMFALPVQVVAQLLGVPREQFNDIMGWLGDYGAAAAAAGTNIPVPTPELITRGHRGAQALFDLLTALKADDARRGPLLDALVKEATRAAFDDEKDILAHAIGYVM